MQTKGTTHLSMQEFLIAVGAARPGVQIVYATGDLAFSAKGSAELDGLKKQAWRYQEAKVGRLVRRRRKDLPFTGGPGGCCFEYLFVKAGAPAHG
jgi:hypothetical protein